MVIYPPEANPGPLLELASNLRQLSQGLTNSSSQISTAASAAGASWAGDAYEAFSQHASKRGYTIQDIAQTMAKAATPLQAHAAVIVQTRAQYTAAQAALAASFGTASAAALAAMQAAVLQLQMSGIACASALAILEIKIGAALFDSTTERASTDKQPTTGGVIDIAKDSYTNIKNGRQGMTVGLERGLIKGSETYVRNGKELERWSRAGRGASLGITRTQAAARIAGKVGKVGPLGILTSGLGQWWSDRNENLTPAQRTTRAGTATVLEGGGGFVGAIAGAQGGAAVGAAIGAIFGAGVGAVPGAVIGGAIGGIAGGIAGSAAGKAAKEWLFDWNPGGVFK
jgi:uncharacterized protein YukE